MSFEASQQDVTVSDDSSPTRDSSARETSAHDDETRDATRDEELRDEVAAEEAAAGEEAAEAQREAGDLPQEATVRELEDRLKRLAADYANYQKRVQRDRAKWTQDAVREILKGLLPVLDNLDQAIAAFQGEVKDPEVYRKGVDLVREELVRQLRAYHVERIEAEPDAAFDPDLHEAIMVQEAEDIEQAQILFVARAGYRLGDLVLRPAQVGVKKPKA